MRSGLSNSVGLGTSWTTRKFQFSMGFLIASLASVTFAGNPDSSAELSIRSRIQTATPAAKTRSPNGQSGELQPPQWESAKVINRTMAAFRPDFRQRNSSPSHPDRNDIAVQFAFQDKREGKSEKVSEKTPGKPPKTEKPKKIPASPKSEQPKAIPQPNLPNPGKKSDQPKPMPKVEKPKSPVPAIPLKPVRPDQSSEKPSQGKAVSEEPERSRNPNGGRPQMNAGPGQKAPKVDLRNSNRKSIDKIQDSLRTRGKSTRDSIQKDAADLKFGELDAPNRATVNVPAAPKLPPALSNELKNARQKSHGKTDSTKEKSNSKVLGDLRLEKGPRIKEGQVLTRDLQQKIKLTLDQQKANINGGNQPDRVKIRLPQEVTKVGRERLDGLPRDALKLPVAKNGRLDREQIERLKIQPAHEVLKRRLDSGDLARISKLRTSQALHLDRQFELRNTGDLSRRLNLMTGLQRRGGWKNRYYGKISPVYVQNCAPIHYAGPSHYSQYLWYPNWSPWVDWCWWDHCSVVYDPRPILCRPIYIADPCGPWVAWETPVWQPLPEIPCGTWVDLPQVASAPEIDLELVAVRFVDPGHPEEELGPRFRIWFRNNSSANFEDSFNVMLVASNENQALAGQPESGLKVPALNAGETQSVDIRLPYSANIMGNDSDGRAIPFSHLNVIVDSHNQVAETTEANNGAVLVRSEILPVDPATFAAEPAYSKPNEIIHLAGEGFGPEPGEAIVVVGDEEFQAEIMGWFDLGVQVRIPDFEMSETTAADLIVIRGDGAAANPVSIAIDPTYQPQVSDAGAYLPAPPVLINP